MSTPQAQQWTLIRFTRPSKLRYTVLSVDGGGLRGMIPAKVLVGVEEEIKRAICVQRFTVDPEVYIVTVDSGGTRLKEDPVGIGWYRTEMSKLGMEPDGPASAHQDAASLKLEYLLELFKHENTGKFEVRLSDFFDLCAGTSTGAIVATYLASDGAYSLPLLRSLTGDGRMPFPGSAEALVAIFTACAETVFPPRAVIVPALQMFFGAVLKLTGRAVKDTAAGRQVIKAGAWGDSVLTGFAKLPAALHSAKGIESILFNALGDQTLGDGVAASTSLLVTAFDLDFMRPVAFYSLPSCPVCISRRVGVAKLATASLPDDGRLPRVPSCRECQGAVVEQPQQYPDAAGSAGNIALGITGIVNGQLLYKPNWVYDTHDYRLREVVRASAAAPTYLPAAKVSPVLAGSCRAMRCIDGGVAANNPSMVAMAFAGALGKQAGDIALLSLGTGIAMADPKVDDAAGVYSWLKGGKLINLMMYASATLAGTLVEASAVRPPGLPADVRTPEIVRINQVLFHNQTAQREEQADIDALQQMDNPDHHNQTAQREEQADIDALQQMDNPDHMSRYERLGQELLDEMNDPLEGDVTNRKALEQFIQNVFF